MWFWVGAALIENVCELVAGLPDKSQPVVFMLAEEFASLSSLDFGRGDGAHAERGRLPRRETEQAPDRGGVQYLCSAATLTYASLVNLKTYVYTGGSTHC